jgi:hypothetical protein
MQVNRRKLVGYTVVIPPHWATYRIGQIAHINFHHRDGDVTRPPDSVDMKLHLHVHTCLSGATTIDPLSLITKESYNSDLVTITPRSD